MKYNIKQLLSLLLLASLSGCSSKPFTLQSYVDEHINNDDTKEIVEEPSQKESVTSTIKDGPGADVAWSSTYKRDKEGKGSLQKSLDTWMEEEWNPVFENNETQKLKDEKAKESFKLQHYIDKAKIYMDKKEADKAGTLQEPAHYEKIKKLPVIGG